MVNDRWTFDGERDFFSVDLAYDESGNITLQRDNVQKDYTSGGGNPERFSAAYTMDGRSRLTESKEGNWNGSSISTQSRDELWTLSQTGNWARNKVNLNGDADFTDSGELDDKCPGHATIATPPSP